MQLVADPAQLTAAATDAILAIVSFAGAVYVLGYRRTDAWKARLWGVLLIGGTIATGMGTITHGIAVSRATHVMLWSWIHLVLWIVAALFAVGALYDFAGPAVARRALPRCLIGVIVFFGLNRLIGSPLAVVIAFEGVVLVLAVATYAWLAISRRLEGAFPMALGIAFTLTGAGVQAFGLGHFRFIWQFDHNGSYHLIQLVGLALIILGLRTSFRSVASKAMRPSSSA